MLAVIRKIADELIFVLAVVGMLLLEIGKLLLVVIPGVVAIALLLVGAPCLIACTPVPDAIKVVLFLALAALVLWLFHKSGIELGNRSSF